MVLSPERPIARVVIRNMGFGRSPNTVVASIEDASNIGASKYQNAGGEFHMTLPIDHPQAGAVEPWKTHYALEQWDGDEWIERFAGLVTDFDATDDEVVFYGIDYLALLGKVVDTRFTPGSPDAPPPAGSKYIDQTINAIISDIVQYAKNKTDSPVNFIGNPAGDTNFNEKVTIYSTFAAVQPFIAGLIDSHRQGSGHRSRFSVVKDGSTYGYSFYQDENPGVDRPNLRLEYGGLVEGFNLVGFGDFSVLGHGIGRTQLGSQLLYKSATAPGMTTAEWGGIESVNAWEAVTDKNDLERRVKQFAASNGRVGKRVALGLRVGQIMPFDGYELADNFPVNIVRGIIDTNNYGSGYWTLMGLEWRVFPDGHPETSLVLVPKEDGSTPDPDLLNSDEVFLSIPGGNVAYTPPVGSPVTGITVQDAIDEVLAGAMNCQALEPPAAGTFVSGLWDSNFSPHGPIVPTMAGDNIMFLTVYLLNPSGTADPSSVTPVSSRGTPVMIPESEVVNGNWGQVTWYILNPGAGAISITNPGSYMSFDYWENIDPTEPIGDVLTALGNSATAALPAFDGYSTMMGYGGATAPTPNETTGQTEEWAFGQAFWTSQFGSSHGSGAPSWALGVTNAWTMCGIVPRLLGSGLGGGDGLLELVGDDDRWKRCDDTEHTSKDFAPTVIHDSEHGWRQWTVWHDTTAKTTYLCVDNTNGAAEWVLIGVAHATALPYTPTGAIAATNVQAAIDEEHSERVAADTAHAAAGDPHPVYETAGEALAQIATHAGQADPHAVYQKESEKGAASGYASLDAGTLVPAAQMATGAPDGTKFMRDDRSWQVPPGGGAHPDLATHDALGLATDAELATHAGAADPHTGYQKESEKAAASGYASLDGSTKVPIAQIPTGTTSTTVALGDAAAALDATHAAAADPHTEYQKESEKGVASGYAPLDSGILVPIAYLPVGTGAAEVAAGDHAHTALSFAALASRVTVFSGSTTAVTIARTLTAAITELPAEAALASGYLEVQSDSHNASNFMALYHTSGGTNDLAILAREQVVGMPLTLPFIAGIVHSTGRKLSYTVNRVAGTITYSLFITGYWYHE